MSSASKLSSSNPPIDGLPPNFSRVNPAEAAAKLDRLFPEYKHAIQTFCTVEPGQMLYLPAGWFHEVTSYNGAGIGGGGRLAKDAQE